jgi:hypothetical protein
MRNEALHAGFSNRHVHMSGSRCRKAARICRTATAVALLSLSSTMVVVDAASNTSKTTAIRLQRSMTLAYEKSGTMRALDWFCPNSHTNDDNDQDDMHCQLVAASLSRLQIWNQTSRLVNNTPATMATRSANIMARAENDNVNVLLKAPTEWIWHGVLEASRSPSLLVRTLAHSPAFGDLRLAVGTLVWSRPNFFRSDKCTPASTLFHCLYFVVLLPLWRAFLISPSRDVYR